ncbi:helix-turn-helix transcriptional regulator [Clostridium sp. UBA7339]|uniref:helix-turn-helix domain-containing protein n=1 Tax=Clostridium sp. UBA7339 TaxID=1946376 RepID=UPI003216D51C
MGLNELIKIGDTIKKIRKSKGITQKEMSKLVDIPYSTYSNYENNNRTPPTDILNKIAKYLDVSVYQLLGAEITPVDLARINNHDFINKNTILDYPIDKEKFLSILKENNLTIEDVSELAQVSLRRVKAIIDDDMPTLLSHHITRIAKALNINEHDLIFNSNGMDINDMNFKYYLENYLIDKGLDGKIAVEKANEITAIVNTIIDHSLNK